MVVLRFVGALVLRHIVVKVGVAHHAELLEHLQRTVDGRDVDVGKDAHHVLVDLVGRDVAMHRRDGVQDQLALRRHAQASLFERNFELV